MTILGLPRAQFINLLQNVLLLAGGTLTAKGFMTADQLGSIIGGLITAIMVVINFATVDDALKTPTESEAKASEKKGDAT